MTLEELLSGGLYEKKNVFQYDGKYYERLLNPSDDPLNHAKFRVLMGPDDYDYVEPESRKTDVELEANLELAWEKTILDRIAKLYACPICSK